MFRFHKTLDIVTLFHKAGAPASVRAAALLKQASAAATATATQDQATTTTPTAQRDPFELNITEDPPTPDQLRTILEYVGTPAIPRVVKGAHTLNEALRTFKQSPDSFHRPVTVDWNNGKAIVGSDESAILALLNSSKGEEAEQ